MNLLQSVSGMVTLTLTSACPSETVTAMNKAGITIYDCVTGEDELTLHLQISRKDCKKAWKM